MTKIYSRLSCLAIFCAIFPSSFALADDPCSDASSVDCITITGVRAGEQLSAYAAAQQQAAAAAIAAEQARAAEAQRLGYEAMLRARAAEEAKAIADKQAAAEKAKHAQECQDLRIGVNNENNRCIQTARADYAFNLSQCSDVASVTVTTGSNAGVTGTILGNGANAGTNNSTVTTTTPGPSCQQKWGALHGADMGVCSGKLAGALATLPSVCK